MVYFLLAVGFTVALYLLMRSFPAWGVDSFHAVVFNYYACVVTGILLTPGFSRSIALVRWDSHGTLFTLALGALFIVVFLLIGQSSQKAGVTAASMAGNLSLVIPVLFGLFVFHNAHKTFTALNYTGLVLTLPALALASGGTQAIRKQGLIWPVLYFVASGSNNTLINYLTSRYYNEDTSTVFMIIACTGAILIGTATLAVGSARSGKWPSVKSIGAGLLLGIPNFLSLYFLLKALAFYGNSAAFVFPVYNILTILASAAMAYWLFKEKSGRMNQIGLALAVLAIILISYQELGWNY